MPGYALSVVLLRSTCRSEVMYDCLSPLSCPITITSGLFFARFQKTQGRLQKNSSRFLAKNSRLWRQLWISRKNSTFSTKTSRIFSKLLWIFIHFKEFPRSHVLNAQGDGSSTRATFLPLFPFSSTRMLWKFFVKNPKLKTRENRHKLP